MQLNLFEIQTVARGMGMIQTIRTRSESRYSSTLQDGISLLDAYNHWYEVIPAETNKLLDQVYKLRYQVYCCENNFEAADAFTDGREIDEYDSRSVHSLLMDRSNNLVAGTVRIILPEANKLVSSLPVQQFCSHKLIIDRKIPLSTTAEVSRFAISKTFKNSSPEKDDHIAYPVDRKALAPYITLGLIRGLIQMSLEHGITDWFAVMEPSLLRLLARFGIYFKPIGTLIDYHGMRQPSHIRLNDLLNEVYRDKFETWQVLTNNGKIFSHCQRQIC
jgi:N-acyl amino acid synthase of PEP-CTERM/exosortase system